MSELKPSMKKRIEFWDYLTTEKGLRPVGVTAKRLEKVKSLVLANDFIWQDVIDRHGATNMSAAEFYGEERRFRADHSRSNFWAQVREAINEAINK